MKHANAARKRLSCVCSITIRRGPRKWEESDRGSALMCA